MSKLEHYVKIWKLDNNSLTSIGKDKLIKILLDELKRIQHIWK